MWGNFVTVEAEVQVEDKIECHRVAEGLAQKDTSWTITKLWNMKPLSDITAVVQFAAQQ